MQKEFKSKIIIGILTLAAIILFRPDKASALKNPAAVYCEEMGYQWTTKDTEAGQVGVCKFSETENCSGWQFLTGQCGQKYSYCTKQGYQLKSVTDLEKCSGVPFGECSVCVLEDGQEVEVTKLMKLSFQEGTCGDGKCVLGENYQNCAKDCPSGSRDGYCDGVSDRICDPDCQAEKDVDCLKSVCGNNKCESDENFQTCPKDCKESPPLPPGKKGNKIGEYLLYGGIVVIAVVVIILVIRKLRKKTPDVY
jgi:putative hemolysin